MTITLECGCTVEIPNGYKTFQSYDKQDHEAVCATYKAIRDARRAADPGYQGRNSARKERFRQAAACKDRIRDRSEG